MEKNKFIFLLVFLSFPLLSHSQLVDSIKVVPGLDSLNFESLQKVDSIRISTEKELQLIKQRYDSVNLHYKEKTDHLQHNIDSLNSLGEPLEQWVIELGSVQRVKAGELSVVKQRADSIKQKARESLEKLELPQEVTREIDQYTLALDQLDISLPAHEFNLPELQLNALPGVKLPGGNTPFSSGLNSLNLPNELSGIQEKVAGVQAELP